MQDTVLITGAAGYIGSHMSLALLDGGYSVLGIDDLSTGRQELVPEGVEFFECDFHSDRSMQIIKEHPIDAIIHFAANSVVPESVDEPEKYYRNNTVKAFEFVSSALVAGCRNIVFSSTAAVYGPHYRIASETDTPDPASPYGASKLFAEGMLADLCKVHGASLASLRYFNVAGADPRGRSGQSTPNATHLIKVCAEAAVGKRKHITIYGRDYDTHDGTGVRDYIHVTDLCTAHLEVLKLGKRNPGRHQLFNVGYGKGFSVNEIVQRAQELAPVKFQVEYKGRRAGDLAELIANNAKIRSETNWTPEYDDIDDIIRGAIHWEMRDNSK